MPEPPDTRPSPIEAGASAHHSSPEPSSGPWPAAGIDAPRFTFEGAARNPRPVIELPLLADPPRASWARVLLVWAGALVVIAIAVALVGPSLVRLAVVRGAARQGVSLAFDGVSLEQGGVRLVGATMKVVGDQDVSMQAAEAHVTLDWQGTPQAVSAARYTLALRGGAGDIAAYVKAWVDNAHPTVEITGDAGRLVWSDALAPGVGLAADGLALRLSPGGGAAALRLHAETTTLAASVRDVLLGPWEGTVDMRSGETSVAVTLDPTTPDAPASFTLTSSRASGTAFMLTIPRRSLAHLGIPATFFGVGPDPDVEVALGGELLAGGETLRARLQLAVWGVTIPIFGDAPPPPSGLDMFVEGALNGSARKPLTVSQGVLKVRGLTTALNGIVTLERGAIVAQLSPHAQGKKGLSPATFDTRTWTQRAPR